MTPYLILPVHWFLPSVFSSYLWHSHLTYFILLSFLVFHKSISRLLLTITSNWHMPFLNLLPLSFLKPFSSLGFLDIIPLSFLPHLWFSSSVWNRVVVRKSDWWISLLQRNSMYFWIYLCIYLSIYQKVLIGSCNSHIRPGVVITVCNLWTFVEILYNYFYCNFKNSLQI